MARRSLLLGLALCLGSSLVVSGLRSSSAPESPLFRTNRGGHRRIHASPRSAKRTKSVQAALLVARMAQGGSSNAEGMSREQAGTETGGTTTTTTSAETPPPRNGIFQKLTCWTRKKGTRELLAELVGTFLIVQLGTGAVMSAVVAGELVGLFQVAAVWIIAVTIAISTTASISGAHLNPAISLSFALFRPSPQFGWSKLLPYISAQLLGGILGSWTSLTLYAGKIKAFETAQEIVRSSTDAIGSAKCFGEYYAAPVTAMQAFLAELFGTMVLSGVVFALTHPDNDAAKNNVYIPPLIGMTVGGLIGVLAPLTQAGFNPARDFAPRLVAYAAGWKKVAFQKAWLYILAPLIGAPIGAFFVDKVLYAGDEKSTE